MKDVLKEIQNENIVVTHVALFALNELLAKIHAKGQVQPSIQVTKEVLSDILLRLVSPAREPDSFSGSSIRDTASQALEMDDCPDSVQSLFLRCLELNRELSILDVQGGTTVPPREPVPNPPQPKHGEKPLFLVLADKRKLEFGISGVVAISEPQLQLTGSRASETLISIFQIMISAPDNTVSYSQLISQIPIWGAYQPDQPEEGAVQRMLSRLNTEVFDSNELPLRIIVRKDRKTNVYYARLVGVSLPP